jgi:hypothetical protein
VSNCRDNIEQSVFGLGEEGTQCNPIKYSMKLLIMNCVRDQDNASNQIQCNKRKFPFCWQNLVQRDGNREVDRHGKEEENVPSTQKGDFFSRTWRPRMYSMLPITATMQSEEMRVLTTYISVRIHKLWILRIVIVLIWERGSGF